MAEEMRAYKDRLFCFIFGSEAHKDWTLSLYNAVNGTAYTNPDDIIITTLMQVVYGRWRCSRTKDGKKADKRADKRARPGSAP